MQTSSLPTAKRAYSINWEPLRQIVASGVEDLIAGHWEEVEHDREKIALAPDWEKAFILERLGCLKVLGLRCDGALVGYNAFSISPHIHSRFALHAINDVLYVAPEHRGSAGVRLIRTAERKLKELGVVRVVYATKPTAKVGRTGTTTGDILAKMGYRLYEEVYSRLL